MKRREERVTCRLRRPACVERPSHAGLHAGDSSSFAARDDEPTSCWSISTNAQKHTLHLNPGLLECQRAALGKLLNPCHPRLFKRQQGFSTGAPLTFGARQLTVVGSFPVLYGMFSASLASTAVCNRRYLRTLPNVLWGTNLSLDENHWSTERDHEQFWPHKAVLRSEWNNT